MEFQHPASFRILFICTANICRSPMAERVAAARLAAVLGPDAASFRVKSAGVWAIAGAPIESHAAQALAEFGVNPDSRFRSTPLSSDLITAADVILTATLSHRAEAARMVPRAVSRCFTIREFARLTAAVDDSAIAGAHPVDRAHSVVREAGGRRGLTSPVQSGEDDIPDPYGQSIDAFRHSATMIAAAVHAVLDVISVGGACRAR